MIQKIISITAMKCIDMRTNNVRHIIVGRLFISATTMFMSRIILLLQMRENVRSSIKWEPHTHHHILSYIFFLSRGSLKQRFQLKRLCTFQKLHNFLLMNNLLWKKKINEKKTRQHICYCAFPEIISFVSTLTGF